MWSLFASTSRPERLFDRSGDHSAKEDRKARPIRVDEQTRQAIDEYLSALVKFSSV
jgi:hypothetical protein